MSDENPQNNLSPINVYSEYHPRPPMRRTTKIAAIGGGWLTAALLLAFGIGLSNDSEPPAAAAAAVPSSSASPMPTFDYSQDIADLGTLAAYKSHLSALTDVVAKAQSASDTGSMQAVIAVGDDFVRVAQAGLDLLDIPDAGPAANRAWDDAMGDMRRAGAYMQLGLLSPATEEMENFQTDLDAATAALSAARA